MKTAEDVSDEPTREDDEAVARLLHLAWAGHSLAAIADDADRDIEWVIEQLYEHRDVFRSEFPI